MVSWGKSGIFLRDFFSILTVSSPLENPASQNQFILTKMLIERDGLASLYYNFIFDKYS